MRYFFLTSMYLIFSKHWINFQHITPAVPPWSLKYSLSSRYPQELHLILCSYLPRSLRKEKSIWRKNFSLHNLADQIFWLISLGIFVCRELRFRHSGSSVQSKPVQACCLQLSQFLKLPLLSKERNRCIHSVILLVSPHLFKTGENQSLRSISLC